MKRTVVIAITFAVAAAAVADDRRLSASDVPFVRIRKGTKIVIQGERPAASHPRYGTLITEAGRMHGVDPRLIAAVVRRESAWNPLAVSRAGARGLMQLMPATASMFGVSDLFDPRQNIFAGTRYLRSLLDRFDGDVSLALAAYNAGPGAVAKYNGVPPYRETKAYVAAVRKSYDKSLVN
jgi:soluble lytic murein transglycosylase-like protein